MRRIVSVDENFDLPESVSTRLGENISNPNTTLGRKLDETFINKNTPNSLVEGVGIKRFITTTNVEAPLTDGDLVFVIESPRYFTDFSNYPTGAKPDDWTQRWVSDTFTVESSVGATGSKALVQTSSGQARRGLSWNVLDSNAARTADVEVVFRWRTSGQGGARAVLRGAGTPAKETGIGIGHNDSGKLTIINTYNSGVVGNPGGTPPYEFVQNDWYITRARAFGNTISARTWNSSVPEPAVWWTVPNTLITAPGWVGVFPFGVGTKEYDWFGVAFDGGRAPMSSV